MINAKELRLGNLVEFNNHIQPKRVTRVTPRFFASLVSGLSFEEEQTSNIELSDYWQPIPLSEDILKKCGFIKDRYGCWVNVITIDVFRDGEYWYYYTEEDRVEILHLHQLQNLFFALCGEELPVKL